MTLVFRLMAHLASQTQHVINEYECESLTQIQNLHDKTQQVFTQFIDTITFLAESPDKYRQLLPPSNQLAEILANQYKLSYQQIFHIIRKSLKPVQELQDSEIQELSSLSGDMFNKCF